MYHIKQKNMKNLFNWLLKPPVEGYKEIIIIRLMTGGVFLWEGILKFVYPNQGVGRFTKLGFHMPEINSDMVATIEIVGRLVAHFWLAYPANSLVFCVGNDSGDINHKNFVVFGYLAAPWSAFPAKNGYLGSIS